MKVVTRVPAIVVRAIIRLYRRFISPTVGFACRFEPTCSCYAEQAISRFGVAKGGVLAAWRLLRCHPFAKSGMDPVPETFCGGSKNPRRSV
jgi:putative membrane protein insertion efficiency factor